MNDPTALPPLQDIIAPTGRLPIQRRMKTSRGARHQIDEPVGIMAGGAVPSGLQALLTPTLSTHAGATTLSHLGSRTSGSRITIPLPAVLAATAVLSKGILTPSLALGMKEGSVEAAPSMLIDTEWFSVDAYPQSVRNYLLSSFSFEIKPSNPGSMVKDTQMFLRLAYANLNKVGLNIKIAGGLKELFDSVLGTDSSGGLGKPDHLYEESDIVANTYQVAAYVISKLLWNLGASKPLRDYREVTYPGVIMASYVQRFAGYYDDLIKVMDLNNPRAPKPYLDVGGRRSQTDEAIIKHLGQRQYKTVDKLNLAWVHVPILTRQFRIAAEYAKGAATTITDCSAMSYKALQDAALNVRGLSETTIVNNIELKIPPASNPLSDQIRDARCSYFLGLIKGTIKPSDTSKAVTGGDPGIEPYPNEDDEEEED